MSRDDSDNYDLPPLVNPYAYGYGDSAMAFAAEEGFQAVVGESLEADAILASEDEVIAALRSVHDPEIPVNIFDLGLIYECAMDDIGDVRVKMTLTAPACPVAGEMPGMVAEAVAMLDGVGKVTVVLTWSPPWSPEMMSEDAKLALGF